MGARFRKRAATMSDAVRIFRQKRKVMRSLSVKQENICKTNLAENVRFWLTTSNLSDHKP